MLDIDWIRKTCLAFPDSTENVQWGENLCFKVRGKLFTLVDLSQGKLAPICLKSDPERFHELLEIEGISPAPYLGRYKWVLLSNSGVLPAQELEDLIRTSYELVVAKAPKRSTRKSSRKKKTASKRSAKSRR